MRISDCRLKVVFFIELQQHKTWTLRLLRNILFSLVSNNTDLYEQAKQRKAATYESIQFSRYNAIISMHDNAIHVRTY